MVRRTGTLQSWDDARGFGFVEAHDGTRLFMHVSSVESGGARPKAGDRVSFAAGEGRDGRPSAIEVAIAGALPAAAVRRGVRGTRMRDHLRMGAAFLILVLAVAAAMLEQVPFWVPGLYLALGALSASAYLLDKRAARAGQWRTSERFLLGLDLLGGIAGGLMGQRLLHHKTAKADFVLATAATAVLHLGLLLSLITGLASLPMP